MTIVFFNDGYAVGSRRWPRSTPDEEFVQHICCSYVVRLRVIWIQTPFGNSGFMPLSSLRRTVSSSKRASCVA